MIGNLKTSKPTKQQQKQDEQDSQSSYCKVIDVLFSDASLTQSSFSISTGPLEFKMALSTSIPQWFSTLAVDQNHRGSF